jgi:diguanylate cyclase (GGDEF)-like protein/PAS domain S-box-containing protein
LGTLIGFEGTSRDITERKRAELLLKQTHQNYETFFNTIDDLLFVLEDKGNIIHVNSTVINRLGFSMEELIGQSVLMIHPPERREEAGRIVGEMLAGTAEFCPVPIITKAGNQISVETRVSRGFWDEKPAIFGVTKDISRIKLSEEKFSKLFHMNPSACGLSSLDDHKYIEVNEAFYNLLGFDKKEVIGYTAAALGILPAETIDVLSQKAKSNGSIMNAEATLKAKNGDNKHVVLSAENIYIQDKKYRFTVVNDFTEQKLVEQKLKENEIRLIEAQRMAHIGNWELDIDSSVIWASEEAFNIYGFEYEHSAPYLPSQLVKKCVHLEYRESADAALEDLIKHNKKYDEEFKIYHKNGKERFIHSKAILIDDDKGYPSKVVGTIQDITERKTMEEALRNSEIQHKAMVSGISDVIGIIAWDGIMKYKSPNITKFFGWLPEDLVGTNGWETVHPDDLERIQNEFNKIVYEDNASITVEYRYKCKDGDYKPIELTAVNLINNLAIQGVLLNYHDISERKRRQEEITFLSYHDQLTKLYNRRFYEEELKRLDTESNFPISIIMGDVNGLKLINDSFGHDMGDELLKKVSNAIKKACRSDDVIARLGGDEFVIILPRTDAYKTEQIIKRIKAATIEEKIGSIDISVSLGWDLKISAEKDMHEVFKNAEDHMYKQKLFESPSMRGKTINAIITTLNEKNKREDQHSHRVSELCKSMGVALNQNDKMIYILKSVGLLHDIGKIAIDENILNKPGKLSNDEWEEIKRHPEKGYRILSTVNDMSEMAEYVLAHHERWDGTGYPKGLRGEEIPYVSRIIAIADAYDAMTSERSYRNALPKEVVLEELRKKAGIQFDPELIEVFIKKVFEKEG